MSSRKHNNNLWWENLIGRFMYNSGMIILFWGGVVFLVSLGISSTKGLLFSSPFILVGGYLTLKGSQKRFNFKRNSGYIVYQGED